MKLSDFRVLTFDCYGTLIDWEAGLAAVRIAQLMRAARDRQLTGVNMATLLK